MTILTAASAVTYLLPVEAVLLGWLIVDEAVTTTLTGIALVLGGVALSRRRPKQPASSSGRDGTAKDPVSPRDAGWVA